jgi:hypothetical protein
MIEKRILAPGRVRRPPAEGFSWIDRRFLRDHAPKLSHDGVLLYFFLAAVSDRYGLSYYKDTTTAGMIRATAARVVSAREDLLVRDLVAFEPPLTQVLSLPGSTVFEPLALRRRNGE